MANNNESAVPLQSYNLRSNSQGNWLIDIDKQISSGPHVVNVKDQYGNQAEAILYVTAQNSTTTAAANQPTVKTEIIDRLTTAMPPFFYWLILLLLIIIIVLSGNLIRLARRADSYQLGGKKRHTIAALIFTLIIFLVIAFAGLYINRETNFLSRIFGQHQVIAAVKLSGRIINPLDLQGVGGIDLVSGNTSLRTSSSGQYIFDNVSTVLGMRLTYPTLARTLVIIPAPGQAEQRMDIFFNPEMDNILVRAIDLEARGQVGDIYNFLPPLVQTKISWQDYEKKAKTIFGRSNITDQEIKIKKMELLDQWTAKAYDLTFSKVVQITVTANGQDDQYQLINENGIWEMIK